MAMIYILIFGFIITLATAQDWTSCSKKCGKECCEDDEVCQFNSTCVKGKKTYCSDGLSYCLEPTKCCGIMTCCPSGAECCGYNTCCPEGAVCCGVSTCCPPGSTCCGFSNCCARGSTCKNGLCRSSRRYMSAGFSWYYLFAVALPLAAIIAIFNYRRRQREMMLREASGRPVGGSVIRAAEYESPAPILATNAGYDQPPPAYDTVATDTDTTIQQPVAAPPSYYDLYKDTDALVDEEMTPGHTQEQTNRSDRQDNSEDTNRNDRTDS